MGDHCKSEGRIEKDIVSMHVDGSRDHIWMNDGAAQSDSFERSQTPTSNHPLSFVYFLYGEVECVI